MLTSPGVLIDRSPFKQYAMPMVLACVLVVRCWHLVVVYAAYMIYYKFSSALCNVYTYLARHCKRFLAMVKARGSPLPSYVLICISILSQSSNATRRSSCSVFSKSSIVSHRASRSASRSLAIRKRRPFITSTILFVYDTSSAVLVGYAGGG